MLADLFWDVATSDLALGIDAAVLIAAAAVGWLPLVKYLPVIGPYVPAARLSAVLVALIMVFMLGFRVADERQEAANLRATIEAKNEDIEAASEAARQADAARALLAKQAEADQERIRDYEDELKKRPANSACVLIPDDFGGLRHDGRAAH